MNEATEAVSMELGVDEGCWRYYMRFARSVQRAEAVRMGNVVVDRESLTMAIAEALRTCIESRIPDDVCHTVYGYLVRSALPHVDWHFLANWLVEDLEKGKDLSE